MLQLEGKYCILIDCHLPRGPVRDSFFEIVEQLTIQRLDVLCLTHPHEDHYHGMLEVVNYFTAGGRTLGVFCDSGTSAREILTLMRRRGRPGSEIQEFEALQNRLSGLIRKGSVGYFRADENSGPILTSRDQERLVFGAVGPAPARMKLGVREAVLGEKAGDLNLVSLVFQLRVRDGGKEFDALLCGDADGDSVNRALERLGPGRAFDLVKVPHHGSYQSHRGSRLTAYGKKELAAAVICSGTDFAVLPDREVMRDFLNNGWTVLLTRKRLRQSRCYALQAIGRATGGLAVQAQAIRVGWSPAKGAEWSPESARVTAEDLANYQTASRS